MTTNQLILLYLIGFAACIYIGMGIEAWRWKKRTVRDIDRAFDRGFNAGINHTRNVIKVRDDFKSSVRVLTGEEGYDDESFASS
jgi:hypothetical protein